MVAAAACTVHKGTCDTCHKEIKTPEKPSESPTFFDFGFNPKSVSVISSKQFDFRDKLIKLVAYIFEALSALFKVVPGVGSDTQKSWHALTDYTKAARMVFGFLNVFAGSITGVVWGTINMARVCRQEKTKVYNAVLKDSRVYDGKQGGVIERILGVVIEFGYFVGALTYSFAFAVLAPIRFVEKCGFKVAESAKGAGSTFGYFMAANHFAVGAANIADFIHLGITYRRETDVAKKQKYFDHYIPRLVCNFVEKICEIAVDVVTIMKVHAPVGVKAILSVVGAGFGFYRVYREAGPEAVVDDPEGRIKSWADIRKEFSSPTTNGSTASAA